MASSPAQFLRTDLRGYDRRAAAEVLRACNTLIRHEVQRVRARGRRTGLDPEDLLSVAQVAALEGWQTWSPDRGRNRLNWTGQVVRWRLYSACRGEVLLPGLSDETSLDAIGGWAPQNLPQPDEPLAGEERRAVFESALGHLSPRQHAILVCRLHGETYADIGSSLGVCHQFVSRQYHLAVESVRTLVENAGEVWDE